MTTPPGRHRTSPRKKSRNYLVPLKEAPGGQRGSTMTNRWKRSRAIGCKRNRLHISDDGIEKLLIRREKCVSKSGEK